MANDDEPRSDAPALAACVQRAQAGDAAAFTSLYSQFGAVVHGIVLAHAGAQQAEDLTQEVFMHAFARLSTLRDAAAFPAWLCTAARHRATDAQRRQRRRPTVPLPELPDLPELQDGAAAPAAVVAARELQQRVLAAVQQLSPAYRETLVLRFVEGLSGPEIAARTGMTHGSVRVNLTRGMALLRPLLLQAGLS